MPKQPITDRMTDGQEMQRIKAALNTDRTIDIVTSGAKTGLARTTEIWFTNIAGRILICGTPHGRGAHGPISRRDWLANLKASPEFTFRLKESIECELPAGATLIVDAAERRAIMSAPETRWYRGQGFTIDDLVAGSPIVDVLFFGAYTALNQRKGP